MSNLTSFQAYLNNMAANYGDWMQKTLETEARDWRRHVAPEADGDDHYHTAASVIIFQVIVFSILYSLNFFSLP